MRCEEMLAEIRTLPLSDYPDGRVRLMEICGTHTMSIAKAGLRQLLPPTVQLLSGPGCPVCVTPSGGLDEVFRLAMQSDVILASYGDLLRVPGSVRGDTLAARRALGGQVRVVYSPMDAIELAVQNPTKEVVFLGVGFETTAPGTAVCVLEAKRRGVRNFSVLSLLKQTEPAVRALLADPTCQIDGFLCPGHVAAIVGSEAFRFLPEEYGVPAVVAGFEQEDVVTAVYRLCKQLADKTPSLDNQYTRVVRPEGNSAALSILNKVFESCDSVWRGLGTIPSSGFALRKEYAEFDAARRFGIYPQDREETQKNNGCRCGEILRGVRTPEECPLFGRICNPSDPVGPCMVSGEGACAAAFKYQRI